MFYRLFFTFNEKLLHMRTFEVNGGKTLSGEITPQGAKNEALQVICVTLLTPHRVVIKNIPDIRDVNNLINLVKELGVEVEQLGDEEYAFTAENINLEYLRTEAFRNRATSLRGSIMIIGPLLARYGKAFAPRPGGDKIGRRRLDTHFWGLEKLGVNVSIIDDYNYQLTTDGLKGTYILMDEASVTGTANILMAVVMAQGKTTIFNAACEPYVLQLSRMLNNMGANISGIGSNLLTIEGVEQLHGCEHILLPDMIEVGSFIGMAAMTASSIRIKNVDLKSLGLIPEVFRRMGIAVEQRGNDLVVPALEHYEIETFMDGSILTIADAPWPGFTPDLISVVLVVATQARGSVLVHQKMFESRLFFVDKLIDMGAKIILCDPHRVTVIGQDRKFPLKGIQMVSPDIRAGVSLLIAALSATGTAVIHNIEQIDRGYQKIDERLKTLGADIKRR